MLHRLFLSVFCLCSRLMGVFGDEVKSVSVVEGQNVTLHTNLTELQRTDVIVWRFKDFRIARIKRSENINPTYIEKFRDKLKMNNQTGDLIITHITSQHSGLYQLKMNITGELKVKKRITVTVYAKDPKQTNGQLDYIIPFSCAAVGFLVVVALMIICKKQRNKQQQDQTREDEITYADPTFYQHDTNTKSAREEDKVVYSGVVTRR